MIAYNQTNDFPEAEFKLIRNLFKGFVRVSFDDSAKVIELKESLRTIDECLSEGDEEKILSCNRKMICRFRNILLAPRTGLVEVTEEFMRKQSPMIKASSLCLIGKILVDEINKEKFGQALHEGAKVGLEYAVDKVKEGR